MVVDLTQFGSGQPPQPSNNTQPQRPHPVRAQSSESKAIPQSEEAKEFRKGHWEIDKFAEDGQLEPGIVDEQHKEFLKTTEFVE